MSDLFICPTCSGHTELHDSPLQAYGDAFAGYVECAECGTSSHEEGFTPVEEDIDGDTPDMFG